MKKIYLFSICFLFSCVMSFAQSDSIAKIPTIKTITMIKENASALEVHCIWELDTKGHILKKTLDGCKNRKFKIKHISPVFDVEDYQVYCVKCDDDTGYIEYRYFQCFPKNEDDYIIIIEESKLKNNKYISKLPTVIYTTQQSGETEAKLFKSFDKLIKNKFRQ